MKLAYLYTRSEMTPWKENVNDETLSFLVSQTSTDIMVDIIHFDGFNDDVLSILRNYDLVFNLCYGYKDAGQVEVVGWLDHHGIPHTSSSFESMIKAQDKSLLPDICKTIDIHTPDVYFETQDLTDKLTYISKPRKGSCHRNINIESGTWMKKYLDPIADDLIIQPYLTGREFSVAVIPSDNGQYYMALPPVEIIPEVPDSIFIAGNSFGKTIREFNPILTNHTEDTLMEYAEMLHKNIGLKGMSRTDFKMTKEGVIYVLDVNSMPNLDPNRSLMPSICHHQGIKMKDLINRMIKNHYFSLNSSITPFDFYDRMMFV